jgi:hypothetical protein
MFHLSAARTIGLSGLLLSGLLSSVSGQPQPTGAQPGTIPLTDLQAFRQAGGSSSNDSPGKNWRIVGDVNADLSRENSITTKAGTGILINQNDSKNNSNLLTKLEHGDLDIEFDYLMAKGSNSGVYLQGRYEIQLMDSWGSKTAKVGDNGSIYQRWDDSRPAGQQGYEGQAARQNASRAPGLWQHMRISFLAPRFDASGRKIENAKIIRAELNGVTIHENVTLTGPTRGPLKNDETAKGPLLIQGDHGPVAFRNIRYVAFDKPRPELVDLTYAVYGGQFDKEPSNTTNPPEAKGPATGLTAGVTRNSNNFLVRYDGTMRVKEAGTYTLNLNGAGGYTRLKIGDKVVIPWSNAGRRPGVQLALAAGDQPVEILYSKLSARATPSINLSLQGDGLREFIVGDNSVEFGGEGPILIDAPKTTVLRSFMDVPNENGQGRRMRVTHAVSVGSPEQVHYTYDLDKGAIVQVWRGQFLDATPMWNNRGDGSSRPTGMVQRLGVPTLAIGRMASAQAAWATDTTGSAFRPLGYALDDNDQPTFMYTAHGVSVEDAIRVLPNGEGIRREMTFKSPVDGLFARLAEGGSIEAMADNSYLIDGKAYYLRLDDSKGLKPTVRQMGNRQELIVPVKNNTLSYSILF